MPSPFLIVKRSDPNSKEIIESMHRLRYQVFYQELGWTDGFTFIDGKEYDGYDHEHCRYVLHLDKQGEVNFAIRLTPSDISYSLSEDHFSDALKYVSLPKSKRIWIWSRTCISKQLREEMKGKLFLHLLSCVYEFGIQNNIDGYFATLLTVYENELHKLGCYPVELGEAFSTQFEVSKIYLFPVNPQILEIHRKSNNIGKETKGIRHTSLPDNTYNGKVI
ncbi:MAG: acyl-homoserine-lactone synthase [Bacteroidota bacterium]